MPALVFLKVIISVFGGGLPYCTCLSTVCAVITAAVTVTKLTVTRKSGSNFKAADRIFHYDCFYFQFFITYLFYRFSSFFN